MPKVTLDMTSFKALASDTRLDILRALDGKKMNLSEICKATKLNKATLHEHLQKLHEAGLVKKNEREGHKWVYYKLSWKGEGLLHPENTRIVVMFTATFVALAVGVIQLFQYVKGQVVMRAGDLLDSDSEFLHMAKDSTGMNSPAPYFETVTRAVINTNQTADNVSHNILNSFNLKGTSYNTLVSNDAIIRMNSFSDGHSIVFDSNGGGSISNLVTNDSQTTMFDIVHDPTFQWIGIACIAVFCVLLAVTIWRYKKNKIPKL